MTTEQKKRLSNFYVNAFYHSKFMNNTFIIKASGDLIEDEDALEGLIKNIKKLTHHGIKAILVYGGGKATDKALNERGIQIQKHEGRRITDKATLDVMKEVVCGSLSLKVYEAMAKNGVEGYSLNAVPSDWMRVQKRPKTPIDFGYVGNIEVTRNRAVKRLFKVTNFVAVPCLAYADDGDMVNINADTIATELAIGVSADKLIFLSNVDGVQKDGETIFMITDKDINGLIEDGTVSGGMQVKMENCRRALSEGVKRIHLINGMRANALDKEIFESVGPGTMIISESEKATYMNEVEMQKAIGA